MRDIRIKKRLPKLGEFFLAAFLMSGFYKAATLTWPIDVTLLTGLLTAASAVWRLKENAWRLPRSIVWIVLFFTAALIPALVTEWSEYA